MLLTIVIVAYVLVALVVARMYGGHWAWKWKSADADRPEVFDWMGGAFFGLLVGLVWPLIGLGVAVRRIPLPAVGAERKGHEQLDVQAQENRQKEFDERVAELERQTEIQ